VSHILSNFCRNNVTRERSMSACAHTVFLILWSSQLQQHWRVEDDDEGGVWIPPAFVHDVTSAADKTSECFDDDQIRRWSATNNKSSSKAVIIRNARVRKTVRAGRRYGHARDERRHAPSQCALRSPASTRASSIRAIEPRRSGSICWAIHASTCRPIGPSAARSAIIHAVFAYMLLRVTCHWPLRGHARNEFLCSIL